MSNANASPEEILRRLLEQARAAWGAVRTRQIRKTLEDASSQLSEVSSKLPDRETEPMFYQ